MLKKLLLNKQFRYLVCGVITAVFNVAVISLMVERLGLSTPTLKNLANILAIEVSLIFSFFVYRFFVWTQSRGGLQHILLRQIPLYHLSTGTSILLRSLVIFPILNFLGVNYVSNTLIGIALGAFINYFFNDKVVFSK